MRALLGAGALLLGGSLAAQELAGTKRVWLTGGDGERIAIGSVRFEPASAGRWRFAFQLEEGRFTERFLAMRPFRCFAGSAEQLCHFPHGREEFVTASDLQPLEYALMFIHTKPGALHVDSRNGVFYKLAVTAKGLQGLRHDVDFDPIVVPKGDGNVRPLQYRQLEVPLGKPWLPVMLID